MIDFEQALIHEIERKKRKKRTLKAIFLWNELLHLKVARLIYTCDVYAIQIYLIKKNGVQFIGLSIG